MDLAQIPGQIGQAVAAAGPTIELAQHQAAATVIVKPIVDIFRGRWGGSVDCDPPTWFGPTVATAVAMPVLGLILIANKFDLTQPANLALMAVGALSVALGSAALSAIHSANRPSVAAAVAALPVTPTSVVCHVCGALVPIDQSVAPITVANNPSAPFPGAPVPPTVATIPPPDRPH